MYITLANPQEDPLLSPSQIKTARDCPRKWAWEKLAGIRTPQDPSAALGDAIHRVAEDFLTAGTAPDSLTEAGSRFVPGLPHLPRPGVATVEATRNIAIHGIHYTMRLDAQCMAADLPLMDPYLIPEAHLAEPVAIPAVLDHKSSKAPDKYGQWTREQFLADPQAILYAFQALATAPRAPGVYLRWLYYWTSGRPRAKPSDCYLTRREVVDAYRTLVHPWGEALVQLRRNPRHPLEVTPNPTSCSKYRGCPHRHLCSDITAADEVAATIEEITDMDLLAQLRAQAAGPAPASAINGPSAMPAPVAPPSAAAIPPAGGMDLLKQLRAHGAPVPAIPMVITEATPVAATLPAIPSAVVLPPTCVVTPVTMDAPPTKRGRPKGAAIVEAPAPVVEAPLDSVRLAGARIVSAALAGNLALSPTEVAARALDITDEILARLAQG